MPENGSLTRRGFMKRTVAGAGALTGLAGCSQDGLHDGDATHSPTNAAGATDERSISASTDSADESSRRTESLDGVPHFAAFVTPELRDSPQFFGQSISVIRPTVVYSTALSHGQQDYITDQVTSVGHNLRLGAITRHVETAFIDVIEGDFGQARVADTIEANGGRVITEENGYIYLQREYQIFAVEAGRLLISQRFEPDLNYKTLRTVTEQLGTSVPPQDLAPGYSTLQRHLSPDCYATYLFGSLTDVAFDNRDPIFTGLRLGGQHVRPTDTGVEFRTVLAYKEGYSNAAKLARNRVRTEGLIGEHRYQNPSIGGSNTTVIVTEEVSNSSTGGPVGLEW